MTDPAPRLCVHETSEAVARAAAADLVDLAHARGTIRVALAGGRTPARMLEILAEQSLEWSGIHIFWSDERVVPPEDPRSNYRGARERLLSRAPVPDANVHRVPAELGAEDSAAAYERELRECFQVDAGEVPRFDLIYLGMGGDGHVASLFPHTPALQVRDRLVIASRAPDPPRERVTFTYPTLNHARRVVLAVTGEAKRDAVRALFLATGSIGECPARGVRPENGRMIVHADAAAAWTTESSPTSSPGREGGHG